MQTINQESQNGVDQRARVVAAFRKSGTAVDEKTAHEQSKCWYRSGGGDWTRHLS